MRDNDEKKVCWSYAWWKEGTFKERTTKEKKKNETVEKMQEKRKES